MTQSLFIETAIREGFGQLSKDGALVVETGTHTGRAAKHRFVVQKPEVMDAVDWGAVNRPIDSQFSESLFQSVQNKLEKSKRHSMQGFVGGFPIEVFSTSPWHIAFAKNMFRQSIIKELENKISVPKPIQVFHDPYGKVSEHGLKHESETCILLDLADLKICIVGTAYAGEIKKSAFSACNYIFPAHGVFPMHASANCLPDGSNSCVLFGLSGTGKTTLSADPDRALIGDDEIIWTDQGLSNLEGGCYAKLIDLSPDKEPEIFKASNRFGSILENVKFNETTGTVDFSDDSKTENTRGSYPIEALSNVFDQNKQSDEPKTIIFLTADAFGALPAVSRLDFWQSQYHFMSGYTAKVAGTELGVTEPNAAFSACFGAPFMPRSPSVYAKLLAEKAESTSATIWMLNTGWVGGYKNGSRFPIDVSRKLLSAIQNGLLDKQEMVQHPVFGFMVPTTCPGVEEKWLKIPTGDAVTELAKKFNKNFEKYQEHVEPIIIEKGGPRLQK